MTLELQKLSSTISDEDAATPVAVGCGALRAAQPRRQSLRSVASEDGGDARRCCRRGPESRVGRRNRQRQSGRNAPLEPVPRASRPRQDDGRVGRGGLPRDHRDRARDRHHQFDERLTRRIGTGWVRQSHGHCQAGGRRPRQRSRVIPEQRRRGRSRPLELAGPVGCAHTCALGDRRVGRLSDRADLSPSHPGSPGSRPVSAAEAVPAREEPTSSRVQSLAGLP